MDYLKRSRESLFLIQTKAIRYSAWSDFNLGDNKNIFPRLWVVGSKDFFKAGIIPIRIEQNLGIQRMTYDVSQNAFAL